MNILQIFFSLIKKANNLILMVILVFGITYTSYRKPRDIILTEMNTLSKDLKIGSSSHFLIKEGFVNYSYANCTQFVLLLKEALSNHGILSRRWGLYLVAEEDMICLRLG